MKRSHILLVIIYTVGTALSIWGGLALHCELYGDFRPFYTCPEKTE